MTTPTDSADAKKHFLDATDAEIVQGRDVIAEKVKGAMRDADRFAMPEVKPPLSEALDRARRAGGPGAREASAEQDALSGSSAEVDEKAGSAEVLKPAESPPL